MKIKYVMQRYIFLQGCGVYICGDADWKASLSWDQGSVRPTQQNMECKLQLTEERGKQ